MELIEQKNLEELINKYNSMDSSLIKKNIIKYIDQSGYKNNFISKRVGVDIQTVYSWRQPQRKYKVGFELAIKLCNVLGISIIQLMGNDMTQI